MFSNYLESVRSAWELKHPYATARESALEAASIHLEERPGVLANLHAMAAAAEKLSAGAFTLVLQHEICAPELPAAEPGLAATARQERSQAAIRLLDAWLSEDTDVESDTWEQLKVELDRDRLSGRKLFP